MITGPAETLNTSHKSSWFHVSMYNWYFIQRFANVQLWLLEFWILTQPSPYIPPGLNDGLTNHFHLVFINLIRIKSYKAYMKIKRFFVEIFVLHFISPWSVWENKFLISRYSASQIIIQNSNFGVQYSLDETNFSFQLCMKISSLLIFFTTLFFKCVYISFWHLHFILIQLSFFDEMQKY